MLVIATVVWLIIVFFSATEGLERRWTEKLISITAPVRLTPTSDYYQSYYCLIDSVSEQSNYAPKSFSEKLHAEITDPYQTDVDATLPKGFPAPYVDANGKLIDIVKRAYQATLDVSVKDVSCTPFETALATTKITLARDHALEASHQVISQVSYLVNFDQKKKNFQDAYMPPNGSDIDNLLHTIDESAQPEMFLNQVLKQIEVHTLITPQEGWKLPHDFIPENESLTAYALFLQGSLREVFIPTTKEQFTILDSQSHLKKGTLIQKQKSLRFIAETEYDVPTTSAVTIEGGQKLKGGFAVTEAVGTSDKIPVQIRFIYQGKVLGGICPKGSLQIHTFTLHSNQSAFWLAPGTDGWIFASHPYFGEPLLLPKSFRDSGARLGDLGTISYEAPTSTSLQSMRIRCYVAGFYDPGIIPIGGKLILAPEHLVSQVRAGSQIDDALLPSGLNVNFSNYGLAHAVKDQIIENLKKAGIYSFFNVSAYDEYDFTKDIFQQLKSEKNLFSLIAFIIIIVACSNIISMLIILVHDKRKEIAILRALGASKASIGCIFGFSGLMMGACGSIIGSVIAYITVRNLPALLGLLSRLQGFDVLNAAFYGATIPTDVSHYALIFVCSTTAVASSLAGAVAAFQASKQNTSDALRSE